MGRETNDVSHHQSLGFIGINGVFHGERNVVGHAHVFTVPHRKEGQAHVDCPHHQGVVTGPGPDLDQVVSAGQNMEKVRG